MLPTSRLELPQTCDAILHACNTSASTAVTKAMSTECTSEMQADKYGALNHSSMVRHTSSSNPVSVTACLQHLPLPVSPANCSCSKSTLNAHLNAVRNRQHQRVCCHIEVCSLDTLGVALIYVANMACACHARQEHAMCATLARMQGQLAACTARRMGRACGERSACERRMRQHCMLAACACACHARHM